MNEERIYEKSWFVILWLILFAPVGIILMWIFKKFHIAVRIGITIFFGLYYAFVFLILVLVLSNTDSYETQNENIAVVQKEEKEKEKEKVKTTSPKKEKKISQKQPDKMRIGDTVDFNGVEVTLNGVRTDKKGGTFLTPDNDQYVIANVTVKNNTDEEVNVSSIANFSLFDDASYEYNITITEDMKGNLDGKILPGRSMRGEVAFDVPFSAKYELVYQEFLEDGQAIWHFTP